MPGDARVPFYPVLLTQISVRVRVLRPKARSGLSFVPRRPSDGSLDRLSCRTSALLSGTQGDLRRRHGVRFGWGRSGGKLPSRGRRSSVGALPAGRGRELIRFPCHEGIEGVKAPSRAGARGPRAAPRRRDRQRGRPLPRAQARKGLPGNASSPSCGGARGRRAAAQRAVAVVARAPPWPQKGVLGLHARGRAPEPSPSLGPGTSRRSASTGSQTSSSSTRPRLARPHARRAFVGSGRCLFEEARRRLALEPLRLHPR